MACFGTLSRLCLRRGKRLSVFDRAQSGALGFSAVKHLEGINVRLSSQGSERGRTVRRKHRPVYQVASNVGGSIIHTCSAFHIV